MGAGRGLVLCLALGCGSSHFIAPGHDDGGPRPDAAPAIDAGPRPDGGPAVLHGRWTLHYLEQGGEVTRARDLSGYRVAALVAQGGDFATHPGSARSDGTFVIPGVPEGEYYFELVRDVAGAAPYFDVRSERSLEYAAFILGRTDQAPARLATEVTLDASGLEAWAASDRWEIYAANAGARASSDYAPDPATGVTELAGYVFDWRNQYTPLIVGGEGDAAWLVQLHDTGGGDVQALARAAPLPAFDMTDGQPLALAGALGAVVQAGQFHVDVRMDEFAALAVSPAAEAQPLRASLSALPGYREHGYYGPGASLVTVTETDNQDVTVGYGNPYPGDWDLFVAATASWSVGGVIAFAGFDVPYEPPVVVRPLVGPPLAPQVDGQDAFQDRAAASATPTLSWTAPAGGADHYSVAVWEVGGAPRLLADIETGSTSVVIPPDVLIAGSPHRFRIRALRYAAGGGLGLAYADCVTASITP